MWDCLSPNWLQEKPVRALGTDVVTLAVVARPAERSHKDRKVRSVLPQGDGFSSARTGEFCNNGWVNLRHRGSGSGGQGGPLPAFALGYWLPDPQKVRRSPGVDPLSSGQGKGKQRQQKACTSQNWLRGTAAEVRGLLTRNRESPLAGKRGSIASHSILIRYLN